MIYELTEDIVARCAKACDWEYRDVTDTGKKIHPYWHTPDSEIVHRNPYADTPILLNSYFWFPRLWDQLEKLQTNLRIVSVSEGWYLDEWMNDQHLALNKNICIALCEAIEGSGKDVS